MRTSEVTNYIIRLLRENHISSRQISLQTAVPETKLMEGYSAPLLSDEFLRVCVALDIRPEQVSEALNIKKRE